MTRGDKETRRRGGEKARRRGDEIFFASSPPRCFASYTVIYSWLAVTLVLALAGLSLFACGRSESTSGEPTANLLAATPLSTHVFQQPTTIIKLSTPEEAGTPAPAEAVDLTRGERTYSDKKCAECHGTQGEGVQGKAKALVGMQLTEQEFTDVLRTGGQGKLGNEHLYGPQAISRSGMKALYAYLKSLPAP